MELTEEQIKEKYKITEVQFEEMYEKCRHITFFNCKPQKNPIGIFVGGQTGAGKGGIDVYSEKELFENGETAAILDVDIYRALYPYTDRIMKEYPTLYTNITGEVTGKILKRIMAEAIENNYNFIFEGTLKNTEAFETMKKMPSNYKKMVRIMATCDIESLLTAFERNYQQIKITGYGRFTNVDTHNNTYKGVLDTIKVIESSSENIVIEIFKRGKDMTTPIKIYSSENSDRLASEVLCEEREKDRKEHTVNRKERLEKLLEELEPKDEFEEFQVKKLKEQIKL